VGVGGRAGWALLLLLSASKTYDGKRRRILFVWLPEGHEERPTPLNRLYGRLWCVCVCVFFMW
jgi:hypothetical protein